MGIYLRSNTERMVKRPSALPLRCWTGGSYRSDGRIYAVGGATLMGKKPKILNAVQVLVPATR